ncbi:MAG: hypothetical protein ABIH83_04410 [Candidatus Micrarchaeota archaeon]
MKKAQVAIEFLIVIGVLSLAIIPILFAMHWNAQNSPDRLAISKGSFSAARIASTVDAVGNLGVGTVLRAQVEMPAVNSVEAGGKELVVNVETTYGNVAIVQATQFEINAIDLGKIGAEGTYTIDAWKGDDGKVNLKLVQ